MSNKAIEMLLEKMEQMKVDAFLVNSKANKYYLSGFTGTDGQVLIDQENQYVIADGRYFEQLKSQSPDFTVVDNKMQMSKTVQKLIKQNGYKHVGFESDEMNVSEYLELLDDNITLVPTQNWIENLRKIKRKDEIEKIQVAAKIADQTFEHILKYIKPGMTEKQVANEIDQYGVSLGADGPAFETIVASGKRSSLPHGHASNKVIKNNELIIFDFGFLKDMYYSDITRTIALGTVSDELKDIYEVTLNAQKNAIKACEAGVELRKIDDTARNYIAEKGYGDKFLHGTGHGLGLTVHEYPLLNQYSTSKLETGMTFTVEPGIYLEDIGGVRIEDDILIDENGEYQLLTESNKELIIIE